MGRVLFRVVLLVPILGKLRYVADFYTKHGFCKEVVVLDAVAL